MKAKIFVPLILILAVAFFTGNWIYGNISAKKLDLHLQQFPDNSRPQYTELKVNPLCSKITFKNFSLIYPNSKFKIESDVLCVKIKHREAMQISKTQRVDKLTRLGLDFENAKLSEFDKPIFTGENIKIDFEGDMSRQKYLEMNVNFPDEKQQLSLKIEDGDWLQHPTRKDWFTSFLIGPKKIEYADIQILLDKAKSTIAVEKIKINTGALQMEGNAKVIYAGQGLNDFVPSQINMKYDMSSDDPLSWGERRTGGKYSLQSLSSTFEGELILDGNRDLKSSSSNAKFSLNLKNLNVDYDGESGSGMEAQLMMLGLKQEDLYLDELAFNTQISDGRCIINNAKLVMPMLVATLNADIKLSGVNMDSTEIETMEMRIANIEPNLQSSLTSFERTFGFRLPRDGDDIMLQIKGSLENPKIKGIHY